MANFQFTDEENRLSSRERSMIKQARENDFRDTLAADAHERRMASRRRFIESNPGAVSPMERQWTLGWQRQQEEREDQRNHERAMLRQQGENELKVAEQKRFGMENQGVGAATVNSQASITNTEREWAGRESIAGKQAENALELEKERQRGGLEIEKERGRNSLLTEEERQAGALDIETQRGKSAAEINKATLESQERINKATLAAQQGRKGAMTPEQESAAARDLIKQTSRNGMPTMSYEDALKQIRGGGQQGGETWPGYSAEATAELKRRGYILVNGKPVKNS